jgi:hypothetical protein
LETYATQWCTIKKGTPILGIAVAIVALQNSSSKNPQAALTPQSLEQIGGSLLFDLPCVSDSVYLKIDGRAGPFFGASYTQRLPFTEASISRSYLSVVRWLLTGTLRDNSWYVCPWFQK